MQSAYLFPLLLLIVFCFDQLYRLFKHFLATSNSFKLKLQANPGADLGGVDRVASHPLHDWPTKVM